MVPWDTKQGQELLADMPQGERAHGMWGMASNLGQRVAVRKADRRNLTRISLAQIRPAALGKPKDRRT